MIDEHFAVFGSFGCPFLRGLAAMALLGAGYVHPCMC